MRKYSGFTILELLIGLAITLVILAFVIPMTISFFNLNKHYSHKLQRLQVMQKIVKQIRQDLRANKKVTIVYSGALVIETQDKNKFASYITYSIGKDRPHDFYRTTFANDKKQTFHKLTEHLQEFVMSKNDGVTTLKITLRLPRNKKGITQEVVVFTR